MDLSKILFRIAVLIMSWATLAHSLKCFSCTDNKSCKAAKKYSCTPALANQTRNYLDAYHKNVVNTTNSMFNCFRETHKGSKGEFIYKGCIYAHVSGCSLEMKDFYSPSSIACKQCDSDGCNPAGRIHLAAVTLPAMAFIVAFGAKFLLWKSIL